MNDLAVTVCCTRKNGPLRVMISTTDSVVILPPYSDAVRVAKALSRLLNCPLTNA